jgi:uncharacterized protein YlxW (UPF0749 family)
MSLLVEAATNPLDAGYAEAAARRAQAQAPSRRDPGRVAVVALLALLLGVGTAWAVRELRAPEPDVVLARAALQAEVADQRAVVQELADRNAEIAAEVEALSAGALASGGRQVFEALASQGAAVGTVAVAGPGMTVTLADSARAATGDEQYADERVQDVDLQIVVNGLWEAGAEAIVINGQRLTAVSAIRSAGQAVLVDLVPLVGPYRVEAVGDPGGLQAGLARSAAASHLALLTNTYGIGVQTSIAEQLELPASQVPTLRYATPIDEVTVAPDGSGVSGSVQSPGESQ